MEITANMLKTKGVSLLGKLLNKYNEVVLFPDKLEKANEMLKTIGLPEFNIDVSKSQSSIK